MTSIRVGLLLCSMLLCSSCISSSTTSTGGDAKPKNVADSNTKETDQPSRPNIREKDLALSPQKKDEDPRSLAVVSGTVTYKGMPIPAGTITFHHAKGKTKTVALLQDGKYLAKDIPFGDMVVTIDTESVKKATDTKSGSKPTDTKDDGGTKYVRIPVMYADPRTSGLSFKVEHGKQRFDVQLD